MASQHVQKLSATKQRQSLGEVKKLEKAKAASSGNKFPRTTVLNPHELEWSDIEESEERELLACLESVLQCLQPPKFAVPLKTIQKVEKGKRAEFRRKYQKEQVSATGFDTLKYNTIRTDVSLGVNSVSKSLEKDDLIGIIIEKDVDPPMITKLLIPPARSRDIPIIAISGLSKICQRIIKNRCIALGLKKNCGEADHALLRIYSSIISICGKGRTNDDADADTSTANSPAVSNPEVEIATGKKRKGQSPKKNQYIPPKIRKV